MSERLVRRKVVEEEFVKEPDRDLDCEDDTKAVADEKGEDEDIDEDDREEGEDED
jgi:hypothetical protein